MSDYFLSEIRLASFNFPPHGWAFCQGQLLPINQNQALFSLLGTTYGGNGQTTFALPDLRGRIAVGVDSNDFVLGQVGGQESHLLLTSEMPSHRHTVGASSKQATTQNPAAGVFAATPLPPGSSEMPYATIANSVANPGAITSTGGGAPHSNMMPTCTLNYMIALVGIFPSPN